MFSTIPNTERTVGKLDLIVTHLCSRKQLALWEHAERFESAAIVLQPWKNFTCVLEHKTSLAAR